MEKNSGIELKEGMIFTVEPMINLGKFETKTLRMVGLQLQKINHYQHNLNTLLV